jgi:glycosyl hydrolase family 9/cellulase-like Ig domain-containing protein
MNRRLQSTLARCLLTLAIPAFANDASAQTFSRDLKVDIAVNQVGFTPGAAKCCVLGGDRPSPFQVIRADTLAVAFSGTLVESNGDFGNHLVGDFSQVTEPGIYYIKAGQSRSVPFRISPSVYDDSISMIVRYFALQRCGPSTTGYFAPCHCDDAVRLDNGKHQDTTGGWHDASDLRKWVGATIHGMIGLSHVYELTESAALKKRIRDELRWGNRYFLNMQEPPGYVMSHVGGDALAHGDGNRWTDNVIGPEGGEPNTIAPLPGGSGAKITIVGDKDDRVVATKPLDRLGQYKFIIAQAMSARLTQDVDPAYSATCLKAAESCYDWCKKDWPEKNTGSLGASMAAALELYKATTLEQFKRDAIDCASQLATLQVTEPIDPNDAIRGFYRTALDDAQPYRDIWHGCWHLFALCDLIELFPDHSDESNWRKAVRLYTQDYLSAMARRSSFGIVPHGLYAGHDPGGDRRIGDYRYRYFMSPDHGWWVGINANIASAGIGLLRAAQVLDELSLRKTAQQQFDWILGSNPFRASTVEGLGWNHPPRFVNGGEFYPPTPRLPGAVMNGLGGTSDDHPHVGDGIYNVSEYWTPMVGYTVWLAALLQASP